MLKCASLTRVASRFEKGDPTVSPPILFDNRFVRQRTGNHCQLIRRGRTFTLLKFQSAVKVTMQSLFVCLSFTVIHKR